MRMSRRNDAPATERVEGALLGRVGALADAVVEDMNGCGTGSIRGRGKMLNFEDQTLDGPVSIK